MGRQLSHTVLTLPEDLSSISRTHVLCFLFVSFCFVLKQEVVACAYDLSTKQAKIGDPQRLLGSQARLLAQ